MGRSVYMKLKERLKAYIVGIIEEETVTLKNRIETQEEKVKNLQNLNAAMEGYAGLEENVRNLNAAMEGYAALAENVRNLNASVKDFETVAENVRNLNAAMEGYAALAENVRNLNAAMENQEALEENVRNLNALMKDYEALAENVRNLNATIESYEALTENVRNLNATMEEYESLAENVRNLNAAMEDYKTLSENVQNLNLIVKGYEIVAENVRNLNIAMGGQEALAENVRNLNATVKNYEVLAENVRNLNATVESYEVLIENVRNLNATVEGYKVLTENVRNLNALMEGYKALEENVRNLNDITETFKTMEKNIQNLNVMLENYENIVNMTENNHSTLKMQKIKINRLENRQNKYQFVTNNYCPQEKNDVLVVNKNMYSGIDYFDFENYFRGSIELIKRNQRQYVKYYKGKSNVIDLGCGRGEFLDLLRENNIEAKGVDLYEEFVEMCKMNGLNAVCDDAIHFLGKQNEVGGIFSAQVIEHLTVEQIVELCKLAYDKLEKGAYLIMETPNPTCLAIYSQAFYIDPSHNKPVHPLTIKYILEKTGFTNIDIIYTDTSKLSSPIPPINGIENAELFNGAMHLVSEMLFGSQDYAIVAKK